MLRWLGGAIMVLAVAQPATAIRIEMTGVVTRLFGPDAAADGLAVGQRFRSVIELDENLPLSIDDSDESFVVASLDVPAPPAVFTTTIGPWTLEPGTSEVAPEEWNRVQAWVADGADEDAAGVYASTQQIAGSGLDLLHAWVSINLSGSTYDPDVLTSLSLADLAYADWPVAHVELRYFKRENRFNASGALGVISEVRVVPEPATALLVGGGLAALGCAAHRQTRPPDAARGRRAIG